jgi:dipeptidyl aminopeptidase/acylaminoacyl peptidase
VNRPCGSWPSPVSARALAEQGLRLSAVAVHGDDVYWIEGRPSDGGRNALVRRTADGRISDVLPAGFNVRTRVHEYGGGAYLLHGGAVFFSNFADQRVYRAPVSGAVAPVPITGDGRWCYADYALDRPRRRVICVREDHTQPGVEAVTTLVSVPLDGGAAGEPLTSGDVLASGFDFYSSPSVSPDGSRLAWLCWRHPNMPWDGTDLWVAEIADDGSLRDERRLAGGARESIYQPGWAPTGELYFASDRDNWWRLYRIDLRVAKHGEASAVVRVLAHPPEAAELGRPQWIFGTATWRFATDDRLVVSYTVRGRWHLGVMDLRTGGFADVPTDLEPDEWLATTATHAVLVAGSPTMADAVVTIDLASGEASTLRASSTLALPAGAISVSEAIEFPTGDGVTAHAFYYPPRGERCEPMANERPPLIVIGHGGPIAATQSTLDLKIQYWTSRGFAVVDVNYGGSTGFGRAYRERLNGQWGIVDVADLINAARYLVREGKADPRRLAIRGGSAGGYTVLAALTMFPDAFQAGASYYGISDLEVLLSDSHKFEARCLDILVGPYPAMKDVYRARSPIHHIDRLSCPLILFQGLEDKVVPPNQSEMMAEALRAKDRTVAYLAFEGEQHGFRKAETIIRSQEAELYFYGAVFGFTPADVIESVPIENAGPRLANG